MPWLSESEVRVGLGCMRLSTDEDRDDERALATIAAAIEAGVTVFDTARSYDDNERLLALALRGVTGARVMTKGGMSRGGGGWVPDGRAKAIRADCEASLEALGGTPIDFYLLHAPDPGTPWRTTLRALARLVDDGLVRRVGVANVNRPQLDEALERAPVAAVQVALSLVDDRALRGGLVERCADAGVAVIAHPPLGGVRRAGSLARNEALAAVAKERGATPAEVALAWLLAQSPAVAAIPGARRPETAVSASRAAALELAPEELEALGRPRPQARSTRDGDVVLVMGIPGAGKTRLAADYAARGYRRLNRDERAGSLRDLAAALEEKLAEGEARLVLDNTYVTRAARSDVVDAARRHGVPVRCVWLDAPLAQAQFNLVERLLAEVGSLPGPEDLARLARERPGVMAPTWQMRMLRELEPPTEDEGFAAVERVEFRRSPREGRSGVFLAAAAVDGEGWQRLDPEAPHLVFDWAPDAPAEAAARVTAAV